MKGSMMGAGEEVCVHLLAFRLWWLMKSCQTCGGHFKLLMLTLHCQCCLCILCVHDPDYAAMTQPHLSPPSPSPLTLLPLSNPTTQQLPSSLVSGWCSVLPWDSSIENLSNQWRVSSCASAFPARSLGFTIFDEIYASVTVFNLTIEVVTFVG